MTEAEAMILEFKKYKCDITGAIYLALYDSKQRYEYFDNNKHFLFVKIYYLDGSKLRVHRNGWVRAYDNSTNKLLKSMRIKP